MGNWLPTRTVADQKKSSMNIVIAGTEEGIVMVESGALEVSEESGGRSAGVWARGR